MTQWIVWRVTYGTYSDPDVPPQFVAGPMPFERAMSMALELGFGYCIKPKEQKT